MRLLRYCFPSLFRLLTWLREGLTPQGQALTLTVLVAGVGQFLISSYLDALFAATAALWLAAWFANRWFTPHLLARMQGPPAAHCGEETAYLLQLRRAGWLPAYDLEARLSAEWRAVPAGEGTFSEISAAHWESAPILFTPPRRGVFAWPLIDFSTTFPFHLHRSSTRVRPEGELVVYPYRGAGEEEWLGLAPLLGELVESSVRGGDLGEYVGSREYFPGLSSRRWDYRRWARVGKPVVREFQQADRPRLTLLTDLFVPAPLPAGKESEAVEAALSATAMLIDLCWERRIEVERLFLGPRELLSRNGGLDRDQMLEQLARAQPLEETNWPLWEAELDRLPANEALIVVLQGWSPLRQSFAERLQARFSAWQGLVIRDGPRADSLPSGFDMPLRVVALDGFRPRTNR